MVDKKEEYLFLENSQDLYDVYGATCTNWANKFIYKKGINVGNIIVFALIENTLNKITFNNSDLKKIRIIYSIIKIYFGSNFVNIICSRTDNGNSILNKIGNSPIMMNWIFEKFNINPNMKNQLLITEVIAMCDGFDKVYKIEFNQYLKDDNILNPKSEEENTRLALNYLKDGGIENSINPIEYIQYNKNDLNQQQLKKSDTENKKNNMKYNNKNTINDNMKNNNLINKNEFNNLNNNSQNNMISNQNENINNKSINNNMNFNNNQNQNFFNQNLQNFGSNQLQQQMMMLQNNQLIMNNLMNNMAQMNILNKQINCPMNNFNLINMNQNNSQNNIAQEKVLNYIKEMLENSSKLLQLDPLKNKDFLNLYFSKKGLSNVGLTCYMNSTLQCLLHIVELSFYIVNSYNEFKNDHLNMIKNTATKGKLSDEFRKILINVLLEKEGEKGLFRNRHSNSFAPSDFNNLIGKLNPQFKRYEANDAKDLIIYLLQEMHEELNYYGGKKLDKIPKCNQLNEAESFDFFYKVNSTLNFSIISYLFWGIVKQITICYTCKNNLFNFQYFQYLSFPLYSYSKGRFNIYNGLKDYTKKEILKGDNKFYCQKCGGLREAEVQSGIYYPPQYLLINFDYGKDKKYKPIKIDFGAVIFITKEFLNSHIESVNYDLVAVSSHIGSSGSSGHYIAFCKDPNNIWHKFNDSSHDTCKFEDTYNYSPYLLIYKKTN